MIIPDGTATDNALTLTVLSGFDITTSLIEINHMKSDTYKNIVSKSSRTVEAWENQTQKNCGDFMKSDRNQTSGIDFELMNRVI